MSTASIPYLKKHDNGIFYVHWTEGRIGKRVSTRSTDISAAKAFLSSWLMMENKAAVPEGESLLVRDLWAIYDEKHIQVEMASDAATYAWKNLEPHFGDFSVSYLSSEAQVEGDKYTSLRTTGRLGRKAVESTARRELAQLTAAISFCAGVQKGKKGSRRKVVKLINPALVPVFNLPDESEPRDRWLREPEIDRLMKAAQELRRDDRLSRGERFLAIALDACARKTAILELTWDRVDFETNVIHFEKPGRKKTKKRRASVPMSKRLRPIMERAYKERISNLVLDNSANIYSTVQIIAEHAGFREGGVKHTRKTGEKPKATGISPHVLRHTAATQMARRGVSLWRIAKLLGNTHAMVEKVYAKHSPDDLREAVDLISGEKEPAE